MVPITVKPKRPKLLRVASIKPCMKPERGEDSVNFAMVYVNLDSKELKHRCTKEVWASIQRNRPDLNKKVDYVLSIDRDSDQVIDWTPAPRASNMAGFEAENEDGTKESKDLVFNIPPNGQPSPQHIPPGCTDEMVTAAMDTLASADRIVPGLVINDRLNVTTVNLTQSGTVVNIGITK